MAKFRSHPWSDLFDGETDVSDAIAADMGSAFTLGQFGYGPSVPAALSSRLAFFSPFSAPADASRWAQARVENTTAQQSNGAAASNAAPSAGKGTAGKAQVLSTVEHHAIIPGGDLDPDDPLEAGTGTASAGQPVGTISQLAAYLVSGYWSWAGTVAHHWASNTITYNLGNLNTSERSLALAALADWSEVANVTFVAASSANINFNHNGNMQASTSGSWTGSGQMTSATVDISSNWITTYGATIYSYGFQTYIHEIGHALGLGHQGPYNGSGTYGTSNVYANDTWQFSVMSYFSQPNYGGGSYDYVITPEMADIAAVQSIYGAPATRAGSTTYGFNSNAGSIYDFSQYAGSGTLAFTIYDSGGSDTLDCSNYAQNQTIDLTPGAFCSIGGYVHNIAVYTTTVLEGAVGGRGSDTIIGNSANNTLVGAGGNDSIDGGAGTDTAVYDGFRSQFQVTQNANGSMHIVDLRANAPDGADDVSNVEFFSFVDQTVSVESFFTPIVIESNGVTHLTQIGTHYYLYDTGGSGPSLKYGGADRTAGQYGAWTPIGAETISGGYEVAFKNGSADQYTVWRTDSTGNYIGNLVDIVPGSDANLQSVEPSFQQDLNGDGLIGPPAVAEFALTASGAGPFSIISGPDGNLWFTEVNANKIGHLNVGDPSHPITEFTVSGSPGGIVVGSDGALWFTEIGGNKIARMDISTHAIQEFAIPTSGAFAHELTSGPDGNIWFAEAGTDKIGVVNISTHAVNEIALPNPTGSAPFKAPFDIVTGPDGNLWFTEIHADMIGRLTPANGVFAEFSVHKHPSYIAVGPDGAMWFTESDTEKSDNVNLIGRIQTNSTGAFSEFSPPTAGSKPQAIVTGSDGALWFTEEAVNKIAKLTTDGHFSEFGVASANSAPFGMASGSDGNIWFTEFLGNKIGELNLPATVTLTNSSVQANAGDVLQASSLFSAGDADHEALSFAFFDATPGNGHFALNGVPQHDGDGASFTVGAADLANLTFVAGASGSDSLGIAVNDGHTLTSWSTLTISVASHNQPAEAPWHPFG